MACAWLAEATGEEPPPLPGIEARAWHAVAQLARTGLAAPTTTSIGRLFDAVAAICGVRTEVTYEGQAAAELEGAAARAGAQPAYPLGVDPGPPVILDARATILSVVDDLRAGSAVETVAGRFHAAIAAASARACAILAERHGHATVVLSGGVFQNRLLLDAASTALEREGLRVLVPERLPPNDGAISYGQAAVAAARASS
jgi:hydrogenase maturation protein HypF